MCFWFCFNIDLNRLKKLWFPRIKLYIKSNLYIYYDINHNIEYMYNVNE